MCTAIRRDNIPIALPWMQELQPCGGMGVLDIMAGLLPSNMHHTSFASTSLLLNHRCIVHIKDDTR